MWLTVIAILLTFVLVVLPIADDIIRNHKSALKSKNNRNLNNSLQGDNQEYINTIKCLLCHTEMKFIISQNKYICNNSKCKFYQKDRNAILEESNVLFKNREILRKKCEDELSLLAVSNIHLDPIDLIIKKYIIPGKEIILLHNIYSKPTDKWFIIQGIENNQAKIKLKNIEYSFLYNIVDLSKEIKLSYSNAFINYNYREKRLKHFISKYHMSGTIEFNFIYDLHTLNSKIYSRAIEPTKYLIKYNDIPKDIDYKLFFETNELTHLVESLLTRYHFDINDYENVEELNIIIKGFKTFQNIIENVDDEAYDCFMNQKWIDKLVNNYLKYIFSCRDAEFSKKLFFIFNKHIKYSNKFPDSYPILSSAIYKGLYTIAEYMIDYGENGKYFNIDEETATIIKLTPLIVALKKKDIPFIIVKKLLEKGAFPMYLCNGLYPIDYAIKINRYDLEELISDYIE